MIARRVVVSRAPYPVPVRVRYMYEDQSGLLESRAANEPVPRTSMAMVITLTALYLPVRFMMIPEPNDPMEEPIDWGIRRIPEAVVDSPRTW